VLTEPICLSGAGLAQGPGDGDGAGEEPPPVGELDGHGDAAAGVTGEATTTWASTSASAAAKSREPPSKVSGDVPY